jgi:hypothetical protein
LADPPYLIGEHPAPAERAMEKYAAAEQRIRGRT